MVQRLRAPAASLLASSSASLVLRCKSRVRVRAFPGKSVSMRSSCSVMSSGVPAVPGRDGCLEGERELAVAVRLPPRGALVSQLDAICLEGHRRTSRVSRRPCACAAARTIDFTRRRSSQKSTSRAPSTFDNERVGASCALTQPHRESGEQRAHHVRTRRAGNGFATPPAHGSPRDPLARDPSARIPASPRGEPQGIRRRRLTWTSDADARGVGRGSGAHASAVAARTRGSLRRGRTPRGARAGRA